jgi:hypothetical protein
MSFTPRFGYVRSIASHDEVRLSVALRRLDSNLVAPPPAYDPGVKSELEVQAYDDCVPRTVAKGMRKRIVLQRPKESRDEMPWPDKLSARWGYWQWLESIGKLGVETTGTEPYTYIELLNARGWCAEDWMPYLLDGSPPPISEAAGPSLDALMHAFDQRGKLKAHQTNDTTETRLAIAHDLSVCIPFACDKRIITQGGIPADPSYVWDFEPFTRVEGWHMIEAESYDERGVLCQNTWGADFGNRGYVRIGWKTLASGIYAMAPIALDWVPQTSEEVAEAGA